MIKVCTSYADFAENKGRVGKGRGKGREREEERVGREMWEEREGAKKEEISSNINKMVCQ